MITLISKDKVVVTVDEPEKNVGGIVLPDTVFGVESRKFGKVVAVHKDEKTLHAGDRVVFNWVYVGDEYRHEQDGVEYFIIDRKAVLARLDD